MNNNPLDQKKESNLSPMFVKEPHEINKILKKEKLKPLSFGLKAFSDFRIHPDMAENIANIQEATGYAMIFQSNNHLSDTFSWKIFAKAQIQGLPEFASFQYAISNQKNGAQIKYALLIAAEQLLQFIQQDILLKNAKYHTHYEKALLNIEMKHINPKYFIFKKKQLTPYQFLRQTIANYLFKTDWNFKILFENFFDPLNAYDFNHDGNWLLIAKGKNGEASYIHGETEKQLITYLINSDYLDQYRLKVDPRANMSKGWHQVVEKQLRLSQPVCENTFYIFNQFRQIYQLNEKYIRKSNLVRRQKRINLNARKSALESLNNSFYKKLFHRNNVYKQEMNKIKKELKEIDQDSNYIVLQPQENKYEIYQKISNLIHGYPKHKQHIPSDFFIYYFCAMKEIEKSESLNEVQMTNISILIDNYETLRPEIPETILQSYLQKRDSQIQLENLALTLEKLIQAQGHFNSEVLAHWIVEKQLILNPPVIAMEENKQEIVIQKNAQAQQAAAPVENLQATPILEDVLTVENSLRIFNSENKINPLKNIIIKTVKSILKRKNDLQESM